MHATAPKQLQLEYNSKASGKSEAIHEYARRVDSLRQQPSVQSVTRTCGVDVRVVVISDGARMTVDEVKSCVKGLLKDNGALAEALNRRSCQAQRIGPLEHLELRTESGVVIARVLRNVLGAEVDEAYAHLEAWHTLHSTGWFQGCEVPSPHSGQCTIEGERGHCAWQEHCHRGPDDTLCGGQVRKLMCSA